MDKNDIHAFYANIRLLAQEELFSHFLRRLSDERQQKIKALRAGTGRLHSLGAWVLLDALLAQFYGLHEREVQIAYGVHGKPYLKAHADIHFNLSHSGAYVLAVLAPVEVGCDIQEMTDGKRDAQIAARFFAPDEQAAFADGVPFSRIWARKESWIKCSGEGMAQDLRSFSVAHISECVDGRYLTEHPLTGYEQAVCYESQRRLAVQWQEADWQMLA